MTAHPDPHSMSTKATIAYGPNFHLYHEVLDDSFVYLELEGVQFEASYNRVMVPIAMHIWEFIRHYAGIDLDWADKTDEELRRHVESEVDERIKRFKQTDAARNGLVSLAGSMVYGMADKPQDEQLENGIRYFEKVRDHQRQIKHAIHELESNAAKK